jgi:methylase of polypeptide subunit release factors
VEGVERVNERRLDAVLEALKASGAARVLDLGCGEGKLLRRLLSDHQFSEIVGMDVASRTLDLAESRLKLDRLAPKQRERIRLWLVSHALGEGRFHVHAHAVQASVGKDGLGGQVASMPFSDA